MMTDVRVIPNPEHCAKFSQPILDVIAGVLAAETARVGRRLRVLDPMAGVGRIHDLDADTVSGDLELGWAACRRPSVQADACAPPFRPHSFDGFITSPAYGSRMADHHDNRDTHKACQGQGCRGCRQTGISPRKNYRVANGGPLRPGNTGAMHWGQEYRDSHRRIWARIPGLVRRPGTLHGEDPGGLVVVNVSNFIRKREVIPVAEWHMGALAAAGLHMVDCLTVPTRRMGHGANRDDRVPYEHVLVLRPMLGLVA